VNFFSTIIYSCFGFRHYRQFLDVPYRATLSFLARLVALLAAVLVIGSVPAMLARLEAVASFVDREFPRFELHDGEAVPVASQQINNATASSRIVLDLAKNDSAAAPTALQESLAPQAAQANADIIIRRGELLVRQDTLEAFWRWLVADETFDWPKRDAATEKSAVMVAFPFKQYALPDGMFNGEYIRRLVRGAVWFVTPMVLLVLAVFGFLFCLFQSNVFASLVSLMEQQLPDRFSYPQLRNLASFAITPAAIIVTVYRLFNLQGLNLPMIYLIAYGIFLLGSANACRPRKEEAPVDDSEFY
jgi:hypothetical protein